MNVVKVISSVDWLGKGIVLTFVCQYTSSSAYLGETYGKLFNIGYRVQGINYSSVHFLKTGLWVTT